MDDPLQVSPDGLLAATISSDKSAKIFDVVSFDMMAMLRLPFTPSAVEWVFKKGEAQARLAVADADSAQVHIYDARSGSNDPIKSMKVGALCE